MSTLVAYDFPEVYPLCQVKEVRGNFVKFCLCPADLPGVICASHKALQGNEAVTWEGLEMTIVSRRVRV